MSKSLNDMTVGILETNPISVVMVKGGGFELTVAPAVFSNIAAVEKWPAGGVQRDEFGRQRYWIRKNLAIREDFEYDEKVAGVIARILKAKEDRRS